MRLLALALTVSALASACADGRLDYSAALTKGEELLQAGDLDGAYELFDELRESYPNERTPFARLAATARRLGRSADVIPILEERLAAGGPDTHVYHHLLGTLMEQAERWREAEAQYRKAIATDADYAPPYGALSLLLGRAMRFSEALEVAEQGVTRIPTDHRLRLFFGEVLGRRKRWREAERQLEHALALSDPKAYMPHYALGLARLHVGKLSEARSELEAATRLRPDSHEAWYQLANACDRLGDGVARDLALERFAAAFRPTLDRREGSPPSSRRNEEPGP